MTDTAEEPRRSPYVEDLIAGYADAPNVEKLVRALEAGDVDKAIRLALGNS